MLLFLRLVLIFGLTVVAEFLLVLSTVLYMILYSYLINPGHPKAFYEQHINTAAPWLSLFCGVPIFFLLATWLTRRAARLPVPTSSPRTSVIISAAVFWLLWAALDNSLMLTAGGIDAIRAVFPLWAASQITKPLAIWAAAHRRLRALPAQTPQ
ncbi:MAG: hypothetical protein U0570_10280 [Phycisphaerales bacterium]